MICYLLGKNFFHWFLIYNFFAFWEKAEKVSHVH